MKILEQIRVHHWVKNLLIFVPLITAHLLLDGQRVVSAVWAFLGLSFCASAIYVINDLRDLEGDQTHPIKKNRPLASGAISKNFAKVLALFCLLLGLGVSFFKSNTETLGLIGLYTILSLIYNQFIKKLAIWDVMLLTSLYLLRILIGTAATSILISPWLFAFSAFFFLNLALAKRVGELKLLQKTTNRGYQLEDTTTLFTAGMTSGQLSVVVFTLYLGSPEVSRLYAHPDRLWCLAAMLLGWILRLWLRTQRGNIQDDPLLSTLKDPSSFIFALLGALTLYWAS